MFNSLTIETKVHILITSIGHLSATYHLQIYDFWFQIVFFIQKIYNKKVYESMYHCIMRLKLLSFYFDYTITHCMEQHASLYVDDFYDINVLL